MKILITGASGMLGHDLTETLQNYDLYTYNSKTLDITDENKVKKEVSEVKPDIIINSSAYTDVDGCETNYEDAYSVNAIGPKNLALISKELDIPLIHISTDYVFDGLKTTPLVEDDNIGPETAYGKTKLAGEQFITEILDKYFILRTAWLYGHNGNNFVETMLKLSETNDSLNVVNDQKGCPTYTHDLAIAISELINSNKYGIYHLTNTGECTWFEFASKIFELSNIQIKLNPVSTDEFPRPAPRPKYSVLSNKKWSDNGFTPLRNYEEALKEYLLNRG